MKTGTLDPIANTATWQGDVDLIDDETGTAFDIGDVEEITLKLRDPDTDAIVLTGTLSGGEIAAVGADADGVVRFTFSASAMSAVCPKTYDVGMIVEEENGFVTQLILGRLPVVKGL